MKLFRNVRAGVLSGRYNVLAFALLAMIVAVAMPGAAWAQDPFITATTKAEQVATTFSKMALAVGAIGMISCLLLGFFGKLNWKWVASGVGVSFAIAIVSQAIKWLNGSA